MAKAKKEADQVLVPAELLGLIRQSRDKMTRAQKLVADYILDNPESLTFASITDLAAKSGASQATIVRFCNTLGFTGYTQLTKGAQSEVQSHFSSVGRFSLSSAGRPDAPESGPDSTFSRIIAQEMDNLAKLAEAVKVEDFYRCVEMMDRAERIVLISGGASASLAWHFGRMLAKASPKVEVLETVSILSGAVINRLNENSLVFLIAFPRYPQSIISLGTMAAKTKAPVVAITDNHASPVNRLAGLSFLVDVGMMSFVDAFSAPLALINALCVELAQRKPDEARRALAQWDEFSAETGFYHAPVHRGRPRKDG